MGILHYSLKIYSPDIGFTSYESFYVSEVTLNTLIENQIYNEALNQIKDRMSLKFILFYGDDWHSGVLGIVASRLLKQYYKLHIHMNTLMI